MPTVDRIYYELGQANDENNGPRSAEIHYLVAGAESIQEAVDEVADVAPAKHEGISLSGFGFDDLTAPVPTRSPPSTGIIRTMTTNSAGGRSPSTSGPTRTPAPNPWSESWSPPEPRPTWPSPRRSTSARMAR